MDQIVFDARDLPPSEAFDRWRVGVADFSMSMIEPDRPFGGTSTITAFGGLLVSESLLPPLRFERSASMAAADGHDIWSLSLLLSGSLKGVVAGAPFEAQPGDILLFSHILAADLYAGRSRTITLAIPRKLLGAIDPVRVYGLLPRNAAHKLLSDFLTGLCDQLPKIDHRAAIPIGRALIALIEAAAADKMADAAELRSQAMRERVIEHLRRHLARPIDVEALCGELALSRSALYRSLARDGGIRALIRKLRLEEAHRCLSDRADVRTVKEIAASVGYDDAALFSRHFQAAFGYPAVALQRTAVTPAPISPTSDDIPRDFARATDRMSEGASPLLPG
jgi:AraC-like DNA-binding protein